MSHTHLVWQDIYLPFTLAHPAAVLPLRRSKLVFSALVVGALAPDLPYFLLMGENKGLGHSLRGVFEFCLPAGFVLLWLFHVLMKRPMVAVAPDFFRRRLSMSDLQFHFTPFRRFALILISLLLGVTTHLLWDGFTHENGYFVKHWSALSTPVMTYRVMPLWHALQYICSVLGVAILALAAGRWLINRTPVIQPVASEMSPRLRWFVTTVALTLAALVGLAVGYDRFIHDGYGWKGSIIDFVIVAITTGVAELILFSVVWHWSNWQIAAKNP